jgi:4-alpha-glucanotransferase
MSPDAANDAGLSELARAAGIAVQWQDARGRAQHVTPDVLRTLLAALGFGADNQTMIEESSARLKRLRDEEVPGLVIVDVNQPIDLHGVAPANYQLISEDGSSTDAGASVGETGDARLAPIEGPGYYTINIGDRAIALAVAPSRSPSVSDLFGADNARLWGVAAQVYSLRRAHGGNAVRAAGFGDFSALAELARAAGRQQAHAVAISPVHAMFSADPARYSPYGPSSRLFLNALLADPAALLGEAAMAEAIQSLGLSDELLRLDAASLIDWPLAAKARIGVMRSMYDHFRLHAHTPLHAAFGEFRKKGGEALESHARFEAIHARYLPPLGTCTDWRQWPAQLRDPSSAVVLHFAQAHEKDVGFHVFLQWLAGDGLTRAQVAAKDAGMSIGLIADLAVGTDPGGSHAWSRQQDILPGLSPGAPPDLYNPFGQSWGITAFSPTALRAHGYSAFIEMLRAVLAHAGGIRIDHVLGLARTWLVPDGASAKDGAFLHYPLDDMLRLITLEAWRHRAIVIGENLGTVPEGFNDRIARTGMMGMNVLWFERGHAHDGGVAPFISPRAWTPHSIATTTTHDLPTVTGWWRERDIDWRVKLNLLDYDETEASLRADRGRDRAALWDALRESGSTSATENSDAAVPPVDVPLDAVLAHVATSGSSLLIVPIEDLVGTPEQPNIPGTVQVHPNWMQRLDASADEIFTSDAVRRRATVISQARGTS